MKLMGSHLLKADLHAEAISWELRPSVVWMVKSASRKTALFNHLT